tara:strand:+ start:7106 stop:8257 length:1152 start_codon:yes stop_codon:yes gene_type:complete
MVKISAFKSIIPEQKFISRVPTKAYANYSQAEIQSEIRNNPYSFLNIINKNHNQHNRYSEIIKRIDDFKKNNILKKQSEKSIYIYQQIDLENSYTGLICGVSLKDYGNKKIKIHEKTILNRELLFTNYLKETKIYAEPVLLAHNGDLKEITSKYFSKNNEAKYDFFTSDGIQHKIWEINNESEINFIISFFKKIDNLYIADGHHRMASSYRSNQDQNCLAYIIGKDQLKTYAFHRKISNIKDINSILLQLKMKFHISCINNVVEESDKLQFYCNKQWYKLDFNKKEHNKRQHDLLIHKFTKFILNPILNIKDERKNTNVTFIPGNRNIEEEVLELKYNEILFFLDNISFNRIIQISQKNESTPPKSTFILPKLPSGLIMMELI